MLEEFGLISHRHQVVESIFNMPQMINLNGTIFLYGKNAKQNDCLSFLLKLDREYTWLHIKDYSGSHIIIKSKKPTENELLFASELALYPCSFLPPPLYLLWFLFYYLWRGRTEGLCEGFES